MAVNALKKNVPHELAALSGGEYIKFTTRNGFDEAMLQLTNHIHNYYLLSFQPKSGPDGNPSTGMHSIRSVCLIIPMHISVSARAISAVHSIRCRPKHSSQERQRDRLRSVSPW
jgi:hypothetical protein